MPKKEFVYLNVYNVFTCGYIVVKIQQYYKKDFVLLYNLCIVIIWL